MIHGKIDKMTKTLCDKPLARRWWVSASPYEEYVTYGRLFAYRIVDQRKEIDCPLCKKELAKNCQE